MRVLCVTKPDRPRVVLSRTTDDTEIAAALAGIGVGFRRMPVREVAAGATDAQVLAAYEAEITEACADGRTRAEVVRAHVDVTDPAAVRAGEADRAVYFREHTHVEDEIWYFTHGRAGFHLRADDDRVLTLVSEPGDLVSIPAGTRHWFDMGRPADFCSFRLYLTTAGFDGDFTGDPIADGYPGLEEILSTHGGRE